MHGPGRGPSPPQKTLSAELKPVKVPRVPHSIVGREFLARRGRMIRARRASRQDTIRGAESVNGHNLQRISYNSVGTFLPVAPARDLRLERKLFDEDRSL